MCLPAQLSLTICGGCRWQHLPYRMQLEAKHRQVADAIDRIAKVNNFDTSSRIGEIACAYLHSCRSGHYKLKGVGSCGYASEAREGCPQGLASSPDGQTIAQCNLHR